MSDLLGGKTLIDTPQDRQIIVVGQQDFDAAKRQFSAVLPVVAVNGPDTDVSALFGRPVVLIGEAALAHADILYSVRGDAIIKAIDHELDPWAETPAALEFAKQHAYIYAPSTASAQDSPVSAVIPFSAPEDTAADASHLEPPPHVLDGPPDAPLEYPDSSAFADPDAPPVWHPQAGKAAIDWSEPLDLIRQPYHGLKFPVDVLPGPLAQYCHVIAESIGCDVGAVGTPLLGVLAGIADDRFRVQVRRHDGRWKERPCLWTMVVGNSSTKKSPAYKAIINIVDKLDKKVRTASKESQAQYNYAMEAYETRRAAAAKAGDPMPEPPERPAYSEVVINSLTVESLREVLADNPRGILIASEELGGWLASQNQYKGGKGDDRDHFLGGYDGGYRVIRRQSKDYPVDNWTFGINGCLTPSKLVSTMGDQEDGLLQRFLVCCAKRASAGKDVPADYRIDQGYFDTIERLRDLSALDSVITLSDGAQEAREEFEREVDILSHADQFPAGMRAAIGKWHGSVARIALTLHLADAACSTNRYPDATISTHTMEKAINLLSMWQLSHQMEFWSDVLVRPKSHAFALRVAMKIIADGTLEFRPWNIQKDFSREWKELSAPDRLAAFAMLENAGWLSVTGKMIPGQLAKCYAVNPAVHAIYTKEAAERRESNAMISSMLRAMYAEAAVERGEGQTLQ